MAAKGLPFGDYWVASDFVLKLRTFSEIKPRQRIHIHALHSLVVVAVVAPLSLCFGLSISWSGKRNFAG